MDPADELTNKMEDHGLWEKKLTLSRNEYLKTAGSVDTNIYYVMEGALRVFLIAESEEHTIRFGYKGSLLSALDSFLTERPSDLYIQALRETKLKVAAKSSLRNFVAASPQHLQMKCRILEMFVRQSIERERDLLTSSPIKRYKRVLKRSPQLFQEVPHKYIASYLRMAPETLSRMKKP